MLFAFLQAREAAEHILDVRIRDLFLRVCAHVQVFTYRHLQEDAPAFRHLCKPAVHQLVGFRMGDGISQEGDAAGLWMHQAGNRFKHRGFAGAVCADERNDFTLVYFKGNAFDGMNLAIVNMDIVNLEHHGVTLPSCRDRLR